MIIAGSRAHVVIPVDSRIDTATADRCIQSRHDFAVALEVRVSQIEAVVRNGNDDVATPPGDIPGIRREDPGAGYKIGRNRCR